MRGLTLTVLIIISFIFCLSFTLKVADWPGGSFGILIASLIFVLLYTPLYLIFVLRSGTFKPITTNIIVGSGTNVILIVGLLYYNLNWDGGFFLLILGLLAAIVSLVFFLKNYRIIQPVFQKIRIFYILTALVLILDIACMIPVSIKGSRIETDIAVHKNALAERQQAESDFFNYTALISMTDSNRIKYDSILNQYITADKLLVNIEMEILSSATGYPLDAVNRISPEAIPWDDHDVTTYLLVGESPENPQGMAKTLINELRKLKMDLAQKGIVLDIEVPIPANNEADKLWIRKHFYKKNIAETLTIMARFRTAILKQLRLDMEKNLKT